MTFRELPLNLFGVTEARCNNTADLLSEIRTRHLSSTRMQIYRYNSLSCTTVLCDGESKKKTKLPL